MGILIWKGNMSEEKKTEQTNKSYPQMVATNAVLQYLREIFMALDNISFQIRTTMNNIIDTNKNDVQNFVGDLLAIPFLHPAIRTKTRLPKCCRIYRVAMHITSHKRRQ